MILRKGSLFVELSPPGEYYQATRFDWAGVFRRIEGNGCIYADEWFDHYNPLTHDAVCGPSEEFVTVSFDHVGVGELFVKPGVGLLRRPDVAPYDWFRLYEIADHGKWTVSQAPSKAVFRQELGGWYIYEKQIVLTSSSSFSIVHRLQWLNAMSLQGWSYNHNFFTFNNAPVGPMRTVDFPFQPAGHWREPYPNVGFSARGIRFTAPVEKGRSVYSGDVCNQLGDTPYSVCVAEDDCRVYIDSPGEKVSRYVFWANSRVACVEPYVSVYLNQGQVKSWRIDYRL